MTTKQAKEADHQIQCALSALRAKSGGGMARRIAAAHISVLVPCTRLPVGWIDTRDNGKA